MHEPRLVEACMLVANADDPDEALAEAMMVIRRLLEGPHVEPAEGAD